jgi:hypothetical protein
MPTSCHWVLREWTSPVSWLSGVPSLAQPSHPCVRGSDCARHAVWHQHRQAASQSRGGDGFPPSSPGICRADAHARGPK